MHWVYTLDLNSKSLFRESNKYIKDDYKAVMIPTTEAYLAALESGEWFKTPYDARENYNKKINLAKASEEKASEEKWLKKKRSDV